MFIEYHSILLPCVLILLMIVLQSLIATVAHRKQSEYIPGIVKSELGQESFIFRSNRTFLNSLENVPVFLLSVIFAVFVGVDVSYITYSAWLFFIARLIHMVLYYAIATNKNPSPRSPFYVIGMIAQVFLLVTTLIKLAG